MVALGIFQAAFFPLLATQVWCIMMVHVMIWSWRITCGCVHLKQHVELATGSIFGLELLPAPQPEVAA